MGVLGCTVSQLLLLLQRPNHYQQLTFPAAAAVKNCSRVDPNQEYSIAPFLYYNYNGFARMVFFCFTCICAIKCSASDGRIFQKLLLVSKADIILSLHFKAKNIL
jgi:hypothetical protein